MLVVTVQRRREGDGDAIDGDRRVVEFWNVESY